MKPFIQGEKDRLQRALKALELMERKLTIAKQSEFVFPTTAQKLRGQVQKHLEEYEQAKRELQEFWGSEETGPAREDVVTIAESFNWHPNESVY